MLGKFINHQEDSLTASVFTHLLHLPIELFWQILCNACYTEELPICPGEPLLIAAWPSWDAKGTDNSNRVVPDVFMRFPGLDLIVEAKRRDDGMQSRKQWENQATAYANEYGDEGEPVEVRMIALGGIWGTHDEMVVIERPSPESGPPPAGEKRVKLRCPVHMCRWSRLLTECQRMEKELRRMKYQSSETRAHGRILSDLITLFSCHGFQTGTWFADVVTNLPHLGSSVQSHHRAFQQLRSRLFTP